MSTLSVTFKIRHALWSVRSSLLRLALAALLILAAGCHELPRGTFFPSRPYLGVVTYNLRYKTNNDDLVLAFLRDFQPDVVCLQEVNHGWEPILREHLSDLYPYVYFKSEGPTEGLGIMSQYPLSQARLILPEGDRLTGLRALCQSPLGPVEIVNVHLTPPVTRENEFKLSLWLSTPRVRLREIQTLASGLQHPAIILGDFNEGPSGKANEWLQSQGFANALSEYDPKTATWKWHWKFGLTFTQQIDHIYVSPRLQCAGAGIIPVEGSDHLPVYAAVTSSDLPEEKQREKQQKGQR